MTDLKGGAILDGFQPFGRTGLTVPTVAAIRAAFRAHGGGWGQI